MPAFSSNRASDTRLAYSLPSALESTTAGAAIVFEIRLLRPKIVPGAKLPAGVDPQGDDDDQGNGYSPDSAEHVIVGAAGDAGHEHVERFGVGRRQQQRVNPTLAASTRRDPLQDVYRCAIRSAAASEVDHIVPIADGGHDHPSNPRSLCRPCHAERKEQ